MQGVGGPRVLARLMESLDLCLPACLQAAWEEGSVKEPWHLQSLERAALTPEPPAFTLKLVNLVSPHVPGMPLEFFKLLPLCWS